MLLREQLLTTEKVSDIRQLSGSAETASGQAVARAAYKTCIEPIG